AVIGHEMSHGFDDTGSQYDKDGNLRNWWTTEDRDKFNAKTKLLGEQFDSYKMIKTDTHSPGQFRTIGAPVNMDAWYKAFDVKPGDKLYKKPEDRIRREERIKMMCHRRR
uniref:Peptidase_M13 domain-containing protein n=1 Tax=Globodera pallida TaxID=36090 RepID=A0A183CTW4_GLOPA